MAKQDFNFLGYTTLNDATDGNVRMAAHNMARGNGSESGTNGGYAAEGMSVPHSTLSGAITTCGDYARGWIFSQYNYSVNNYNRGWYGMGFLGTRSLGPRLDPNSGSAWSAAASFANSTGKRSQATAVSMRATVRLGCLYTASVSQYTSSGTAVGLFFGARTPSTTARYTTDADGDDYGYAVYSKTDTYGTLINGYTLWLSSMKHYSWGNDDIDSDGDGSSVKDTNRGNVGVVRLLFISTGPHANEAAAGNTFQRPRVHKCQGSYAFNAWYRIRMDITPLPGTDKIEIYTAPATDTIGSETWTKRATQYRFAGTCHYVTRQHAQNHRGLGYCVQAWRDQNGSTLSTRSRNHDAYLDALTVYSKNISS
jgi:hypothetical protein